MTFIVKPSRNAIVQAAFKGFRAEQRAETKKKPEPTPAPSKNAKPPRAKGGKPSKGKS